MFYVNARGIIERMFNGKREIVIQLRTKPSEPIAYELPGGRINQYESITDALIREVKEEVGLDIIQIEGMDTKIDTVGINPDFEVECIRPFAAYQTIKGPVDSVGFYFLCKAQGTLLEKGDDAMSAKWISITKLRKLMEDNPLQFSDVDRAGITFYLKDLSSQIS